MSYSLTLTISIPVRREASVNLVAKWPDIRRSPFFFTQGGELIEGEVRAAFPTFPHTGDKVQFQIKDWLITLKSKETSFNTSMNEVHISSELEGPLFKNIEIVHLHNESCRENFIRALIEFGFKKC